MTMAALFYALARFRPAVVIPDRVAVIPAAIYVTNNTVWRYLLNTKKHPESQ